ncbi:MAG: rRNA pseudouridine synthase [Bacteroidetes bacterium HGW-Bacteroidetes-17]|jgi:23S rRNA pseudouridine2605 synthase|nr:MAG: rRNA pseudouridine synthase [Bacteroidetes bacterium HGW-Bacteroidetes-17]
MAKQEAKGSQKHGDFSKFMRPGKKQIKDRIKADKKRSEKPTKAARLPKSEIKPIGTLKGTKPEPIRLNKYIANAGICSRRDADQLILNGEIKINGIVVTELGTKVNPNDKVEYQDKALRPEKLVYLLLNKPKGFITTTDDPFERKTVMKLVEKACEERIFPVGRLDLNTTGLLLFTNDGELAKKLTHPRHEIKKIYHAVLNKPLMQEDFIKIAEGIELEDGPIKVDKIAFAETGKDKKQIGIELHSGKNRIVRRIFESLGYDVIRLDRVSFAGLTKKDVPRGKWRLLKELEINRLKMIS